MMLKSPSSKKISIIIEGIGGSGKTTLCKRIAAELYSILPNNKILTMDEFSNTSLGKFLNKNKDSGNDFRIQIPGIKEYYLVSHLVIADKMQMVEILSKKDWDITIIDGLKWTLIAHTLAGLPNDSSRKIKNRVRKSVEIIIDHFRPLASKRLTFFLNIPLEISIQRLEARTGFILDSEQKMFLQRLMSIYRELIMKDPNIYLLDATQSEDAMTMKILKVLASYIKF